MKYNFTNLSNNIQHGMIEFAKFHKCEITESGICVKIVIIDKQEITIEKTPAEIKVYIPDESLIFRAMTHIIYNKNEQYTYTEPLKFDMRGVMIDGSQANSLLNPDSVKLMLKIVAGMGYNMFMLYMEDCYFLPDEPYFGYMRPKYTQDELKELDDYAFNLGIEMIPCIQTLGHLTEALKRNYPYSDIRDDETTLLVGEEKTYALIEKMIKTACLPFRTNKIHIGLDEAFLLGQGSYLVKNGYRSKSEIMKEHLARVYQITEKYSLLPMMWGDMFFRSKSPSNIYYNPDITFTKEDKLTSFPNLSPIYWDYYHYDEEIYKKMIQKYNELSDKLIFAGCSRNVRSFAAHHTASVMTTNSALKACKDLNIRQAFTTIWGDDNRESSVFAVLPSLIHFAEHFFCEDYPDEEKCSKRFCECVNETYNDFLKISILDEIPGYNKPNLKALSPSKVIMWQDVLLGICDKDLGEFNFEPHYKALKEHFEKCKKESNLFGDMFEFYSNTANVLEIKSGIGRKLFEAYQKNDKDFLKYAMQVVLPDLHKRLKNLHISHRNLFMKCHKAVGWEILDIRYGGAITRVETSIKRISDYLEGNICKIEELEESRLSYNNTNMVPEYPNYARICSASRL